MLVPVVGLWSSWSYSLIPLSDLWSINTSTICYNFSNRGDCGRSKFSTLDLRQSSDKEVLLTQKGLSGWWGEATWPCRCYFLLHLSWYSHRHREPFNTVYLSRTLLPTNIKLHIRRKACHFQWRHDNPCIRRDTGTAPWLSSFTPRLICRGLCMEDTWETPWRRLL